MKPLAIAITLLLGAAAPALAANADAPQSNVDKRNDAGNSTGNDKVDALNRGQLDENQKPAAPTPAAPDPATRTPSAGAPVSQQPTPPATPKI